MEKTMSMRSIGKVVKQKSALIGVTLWLAALAMGLSACTGRTVQESPTAIVQRPASTIVSPEAPAGPTIQPAPTGTMAVSATSPVNPVENIPGGPMITPLVETSVSAPMGSNLSPITKQEVGRMWDSVENFMSVVDRLDGLTGEEKETLRANFSREIELRGEFDKKCINLLTSEEQVAAKDMGNMGSALYQQANDKLEAAMQNDPACSSVHREMEALIAQSSPLGIKLKMHLPNITQ
jgi:hypothetical protein